MLILKKCLKRVFLLLLIALIIRLVNHQDRVSTSKQLFQIRRFSSTNDSQVFLVNTTNCKIPDLDPWDPSLQGVFEKGQYITCTKHKPLTFKSNDTIYIDLDEVKMSPFYESFKYCTYKAIIQSVSGESDHNSVEYRDPSPRFVHSIRVSPMDEHVFVQCFDDEGQELFVDFHSFINDKPEVEQRCRERLDYRSKSNKAKETLNVLLVLVDSMSRLNALRFMPKTVDYLTKVMGAVNMAGFNKVGNETFNNMIPAFTGKFYSELTREFEAPVIFDNFTFVWDEYAKEGYKTLLFEDYPYGSMFNYKKPGFHRKPVDYSNRPFFLSMYQNNMSYMHSDENCILYKEQTMWVLEPAYEFLQKYKSAPNFCSLLLTRLTHDYLERAAHADNIYFEFFKSLYEKKLLEKTVLFFMSDHGMHFAKIRKWYIGLLEERLPMLFVSLPQWFQEKYPQHMHNLKINANRLTSHFDLHKTWMDLLHFDGVVKTGKRSQHAISFFDEMPEVRSCADAAIDPHWCTCSSLEAIDQNNKYVKEAAEFFLYSINSNLEPVQDLCETLYIDKIVSAFKIHAASADLDKTVLSFKITIQTKPGGGLFEGTITYDMHKKFYKQSSDIGRINAYGKGKQCKVPYFQKRLCYCKSDGYTHVD